MPTELNPEIITAAIAGFEEQKKRLDAQIAQLRELMRPSARSDTKPARRKRIGMSAAGRARIAAAQRKRWADARMQSGAGSAVKPVRKKRRLSAAGRKAIAEAARRRWAAVKAQAK